MVSRHPLLRHLAVMVLVVLLPCMSDAATPVEVTYLISSITTTQIKSLLNGFSNENALNVSGIGARFENTYNYNNADGVVASLVLSFALMSATVFLALVPASQAAPTLTPRCPL